METVPYVVVGWTKEEVLSNLALTRRLETTTHFPGYAEARGAIDKLHSQGVLQVQIGGAWASECVSGLTSYALRKLMTVHVCLSDILAMYNPDYTLDNFTTAVRIFMELEHNQVEYATGFSPETNTVTFSPLIQPTLC